MITIDLRATDTDALREAIEELSWLAENGIPTDDIYNSEGAWAMRVQAE